MGGWPRSARSGATPAEPGGGVARRRARAGEPRAGSGAWAGECGKGVDTRKTLRSTHFTNIVARPAVSPPPPEHEERTMSNQEGYRVAYDYTVRFYPRYFTWMQFQINSENSKRQGAGQQIANRLTGPLGMGPEYKVVVAINDDTIYAEAFLDVADGPVILTIPAYPNKYSVLQLDVYGNIFSTALSSAPPSGGGVYAFVASDYSGTLPENATRVEMPYPVTTIAIRTDKYSSSGQDLIAAANEFRSSLSLQTLDKYDPSGESGRTLVLPLFFFAPSVKLMA